MAEHDWNIVVSVVKAQQQLSVTAEDVLAKYMFWLTA